MSGQLIKFIGIVLSCFVPNYVIFDFFSKMHKKIYQKKIPYMAAYFIYSAVIMSVNYINIPLINIITNLICVGIIGFFLYTDGLIGLIYNEIFVICVAFCEEIGIMLVSLGCISFSISNMSLEFRNLLNIAFSQVIIICAYRIFMIFIQKIEIYQVSKSQYLFLYIFPLFSILIIFTLMTLTASSIISIVLTILSIVAIIFMNLFITYLFEFISKNNHLKNELNLFEQQASQQYYYYSNLEEKYKQSRKLQHDMRNHLQLLEQLYKSGEKNMASEYAKNIYDIINSIGQKTYTDHKILNIIVNDKMQLAESYDIIFECEIGDINIDFISSMDITTIFGNLLDNAIEACKELNSKRLMKLKIEPFHDFININICNTFSGKAIKKEEKYISTKSFHDAIGLPNVIMTVEKYGGNLKIETENNMFVVNIIIPKSA